MVGQDRTRPPASQIAIAVPVRIVAYLVLAYGSILWRTFGAPVETLLGILLCSGRHGDPGGRCGERTCLEKQQLFETLPERGMKRLAGP